MSPISIATRRGAKRSRPPQPPLQPEWHSFIARCLRSWETARASASLFLAVWTPLALPDAKPAAPVRPHRARRRPSNTSHSGRRASKHAVVLDAPAWNIPLATAGSAEALRRRYPLVSALLAELSSPPVPRRQLPRALRL